jgi:hypothetical protein
MLRPPPSRTLSEELILRSRRAELWYVMMSGSVDARSELEKKC